MDPMIKVEDLDRAVQTFNTERRVNQERAIENNQLNITARRLL
jgi:hypothetical protein